MKRALLLNSMSLTFHSCRHMSKSSTVDTARDLGVLIDSQLSLSLSAHVAALCRSVTLSVQLRQLRPIVRSLTTEAVRTVHAFISCRLDYCNSLLYGLPDSLSRTLRHVSSLELEDVKTSPRCYASCTGFPSDNVTTSKSLAWHTSHCLVRHLSISLHTSNSSPTVVAVISVQHLTGDASFPARKILSATEVFASLDHECGSGFLGV